MLKNKSFLTVIQNFYLEELKNPNNLLSRNGSKERFDCIRSTKSRNEDEEAALQNQLNHYPLLRIYSHFFNRDGYHCPIRNSYHLTDRLRNLFAELHNHDSELEHKLDNQLTQQINQLPEVINFKKQPDVILRYPIESFNQKSQLKYFDAAINRFTIFANDASATVVSYLKQAGTDEIPGECFQTLFK